jgi:hypothetical protein
VVLRVFESVVVFFFKLFLLEKYQKIIFFKKIIFDINTIKQSKNTKKINLK